MKNKKQYRKKRMYIKNDLWFLFGGTSDKKAIKKARKKHLYGVKHFGYSDF